MGADGASKDEVVTMSMRCWACGKRWRAESALTVAGHAVCSASCVRLGVTKFHSQRGRGPGGAR